MTGQGEKLSRKRDQAIAALLTQPTISEAAKAIGVGEKTLRRWLKVPEFMAAYNAARHEVLADARVQMMAEWRRVRQAHRDVAYRDLREFFDENGRLKLIDDIPPRARRAILRLKKRRLVRTDGSVIETEELALRPIEPHLQALEKHFSIPPIGWTSSMDHGPLNEHA